MPLSIADTLPASDYRTSIKVRHLLPWTSLFTPRIHRLGDILCQIDNDFFLEIWPFSSKLAQQLFLDMDLPRWSAVVFPESRDSRALPCIRIITLLFLLDDVLDGMGHEEGRNLNKLLQTRVLQDRQWLPEYGWSKILLSLIEEIELIDPEKSKDVFHDLRLFWQGQVSPSRGRQATLESYLEFRETDMGLQLCRSLGRWGADISLPPEDHDWLREVEKNTTTHIILVNDLYSLDKEILCSNISGGKIGGDILNAVAVIMNEQNIDLVTAQTQLKIMIEEAEEKYFLLLANRKSREKPISPQVTRYADLLKDMAAGNESWSRVTARYNVVNAQLQKPIGENPGFREV